MAFWEFIEIRHFKGRNYSTLTIYGHFYYTATFRVRFTGSTDVEGSWGNFPPTSRKPRSLRSAKGTSGTRLKVCPFSPLQMGSGEKKINGRPLWDLFWHFSHSFIYSFTQQKWIEHRPHARPPDRRLGYCIDKTNFLTLWNLRLAEATILTSEHTHTHSCMIYQEVISAMEKNSLG